MKKVFKKSVFAFVAVMAMYCFNIKNAAAQPGVSVSIQTFYDELEPYGQWIDDPELGYVWAPDAGPDFKPYATNGHWAATEYGNTWVSDYDWGWAAFHYGRWRFASDYGWEWIPGTEWAPAWVNWRTGGDYYGWAPLGPGIDIDVSFGSNYYEPDDYWVFAPRRYVYEPNIYRYYLPAGRNYSLIRNTAIINNVYSNNSRRYVFGPRPDDVRRYTNAPVNVYTINDSRRPGGARIRNNTINIYRPQVAFNNNNGNRPEPNRVINRGSYNRNQGFNNGNNGNPDGNFSGRRNPGNGQNLPANNGGFARNNGTINGSQIPQRSFPNQNQNPNNNGMQNPGAANPNGNNPSGGFGGRNNNPTNQPYQNQNTQPGNLGGRNQPGQNGNGQTDWRQSRGFDRNRTRNDMPVQPPQNQQQNQQPQRQPQNQQPQQPNQQQNQQRQLPQQQRPERSGMGERNRP